VGIPLSLDFVVEHDELSIEKLRNLVKGSLLEKKFSLLLKTLARVDALSCAGPYSTRKVATRDSVELTVLHCV